MNEGLWISNLSGDCILLKDGTVITFSVYKAMQSYAGSIKELLERVINARRPSDSVFLEDRVFVALLNFAKKDGYAKIYDLSRRDTEDLASILKALFKQGSEIHLDVQTYRKIMLVKELSLEVAIPKLLEHIADLQAAKKSVLESIDKSAKAAPSAEPDVFGDLEKALGYGKKEPTVIDQAFEEAPIEPALDLSFD